MIRRLWAPVYAFVAVLFTVYLLLSTFVLRSNVQTGATEQNTAMFETLSASEEAADPFEKEITGDTGGSTDGTGNTHHGHGRGKGKRPGSSGGSQSGSSGQSGSGSQGDSATGENNAAEGSKTVVDTYEWEGDTITLTLSDGATLVLDRQSGRPLSASLSDGGRAIEITIAEWQSGS
jgi:hypothetical protein